MRLIGIFIIQANGKGVAFEAGLVGLIAAKTHANVLVFDAINHGRAVEQTGAIDTHGVECIYPFGSGQGETDFTDRFFIV